MSIRVMSRVWEGSVHKGSALLLMLAIADHADDHGENAYPSIPTLANKIRMSERQVQNILRVLEKSGELVVHRRGGGRKRRNIYTVSPPRKGAIGSRKGAIQRGNGETAIASESSKEPSKESGEQFVSAETYLATLPAEVRERTEEWERSHVARKRTARSGRGLTPRLP